MSADFEKAIDGAVREMLAVEPRADLRARVIAQLPAASSGAPAASSGVPAAGFHRPFFEFVASGFSRNRVVLTAAAAAIVLAILVIRRPEPLPQSPVAVRGVDQHLPVEALPGPAFERAVARPSPSRQPRVVAHAAVAQERDRRAVAAVDESDDVNFSTVAALSAPQSLELTRLQAPASVVLPSFAPQPMSIRALEVTALPGAPPERREE